MLTQPPVTAYGQYNGIPGSLTRYFWVQAIYPSGRSVLSNLVTVSNAGSLTNGNQITISWTPAPFSLGYDVIKTPTSTEPSVGDTATTGVAFGLVANSLTLSAEPTLRSWTYEAGSGGTGTPGGTAGQLQFNDAGTSFGGASGSTWTDATRNLTLVDANSNNLFTLTADPLGDTNHYILGVGTGLAAPGSVATSPGNRSGYIEFDGQTGGTTSIATTGIGGIGSGIIINSGIGGTAPAAATASTGGAAGTVQIAGFAGGAADNAANLGTNVGGAGGDVTITAGTGGATAHGSSNTGGRGGVITLTPGAGGNGATANGLAGKVLVAGVFAFHQVAAPADAQLVAGDCALWLDATNGAGKLMIKAKTANGTVVTGSVTLT